MWYSPSFPVPTNLVHLLISSEPLTKPLPPSASSPHPLLVPSDSLSTKATTPVQIAAVEAISTLFAAATNPVVLIDALTERFGAEGLAMELVDKTGMMVFVSPMGKSTVDERHPRFGGVYIGNVTEPSVLELVNKSDLVIDIGPLKVHALPSDQPDLAFR